MTILDARTSDSTQGAASFTLRNRLYRIAWAVTWALLAIWTPPFLFRWRRLLLVLFGAKLAPTARVYPSARIWSPANLEMAAYACLGPGSHAYTMATIVLGENALVSQGGQLITGTHDIEDPLFQLQARPITLGARVWIAAEAFVGPGVTVGEGAVLGARGCAFKDLEPWTVYAGNPARPVKVRRMRGPDKPDQLGEIQEASV